MNNYTQKPKTTKKDEEDEDDMQTFCEDGTLASFGLDPSMMGSTFASQKRNR